MLLVKFIFPLSLACCAAQISFNQFNCLRNGECENECPRGFSGYPNCSSCTDDRLSPSSNCTICEDCNENCQMGNFTISVLFHSYLNPDSLCGECRLPEYGFGPVCCDTLNQTENCPSSCEFRFVLSLQAYGESLQNVTLPARPPDFNSDNITTFPVGPDAFNVSNNSNPITVQLTTWTGRFQMNIVVYDAYRIENASTPAQGRFAVDRFPINVTLDEIPSSLSRQTYHGIYGIAQLDLSFELKSDNHLISSSPMESSSISSSAATTAFGSRVEVPEGDNCVALMNSYRTLQILVIILPIIAVAATIIVITVFLIAVHYCKKHYSTKSENYTFQTTELHSKEDSNNPSFNLKSTLDNLQTEGLHHDCDTNPSYDKVEPTANISYGVLKSTVIDGANAENDTDNYYYT